MTRAYVDAGFKDDIAIHGAVLGITVEQVKRRQALQLKEGKKVATATGSHNHRNQVTSRSPRWPVASGEVD